MAPSGKKLSEFEVSNKSQADELKSQMDELLTIADEAPSLLPTRSGAEQKYGRVIADAFFDCISPEPIDYAALRDAVMPFPLHSPRILFVGSTGVGKSRLIQHLLSTTSANFPMRGAGRTTVSDTEVFITGKNYAAVITFFSENEKSRDC